MLGQADRAVGRQRKARHAQAVDVVLGNSGAVDQLLQGAGNEPVRAADGEALVGHGDGHRDGDPFIAGAAAGHQCPPPR